jgi:hypothetical protein
MNIDIIIFLSFISGFLLAKIHQAYLMHTAIKETKHILNTMKAGDLDFYLKAKEVHGRNQVIDELNKFL